jgi:hypothetical protein
MHLGAGVDPAGAFAEIPNPAGGPIKCVVNAHGETPSALRNPFADSRQRIFARKNPDYNRAVAIRF